MEGKKPGTPLASRLLVATGLALAISLLFFLAFQKLLTPRVTMLVARLTLLLFLAFLLQVLPISSMEDDDRC